MLANEAIKELEENIQRLEKSKEYHKDNEFKVSALNNEIEVNQIALKAMKG